MKVHFSTLTAGYLASLVCFSTPALADDSDKLAKPAECTSQSLTGDLQAVIAACAASIDSEKLGSEALAGALRLQGDALFRTGRVERALSNYDRALALKPDWPLAIWNQGNAHLVLGDDAAAEASYEHGLEVDPKYPKFFTALGSLQAARETTRALLKILLRLSSLILGSI
jgi:Flp pilus assembly protein TadD